MVRELVSEIGLSDGDEFVPVTDDWSSQCVITGRLAMVMSRLGDIDTLESAVV